MAARRKALIAAAVPVGFLLSGALVWQASYAAFVDTTSNDGNSWTAGSVTLTDNDAGAALFSPSAALTPGDTETSCIVVTYSGTVAADVRVYGGYASGDEVTNPLAGYLSLVVERQAGSVACGTATGWTTVSTGGTVADFIAADYSWDTATTPGWLAAAQLAPATTSETYRVTYTLVDDTAAQGLTAEMNFVWEAQNS